MSHSPPDLSRRCPRCLFPPAACLCADVPRLSTRVRLVLLRHASELARPTNTGRLAALALPAMRVVDHGLAGARPELSELAAPGAAVLFPSPHPLPPSPPPRTLVVLDGTWGQARRMLQRIPELRGLPRLSLPPAPGPAAAPMRVAAVRGGRATLDALAAALLLLGEEEPARALGALHAIALERGWRLRGPQALLRRRSA